MIPKNKLQRYCQLNHIEFPKYRSWKTDDCWYSTVHMAQSENIATSDGIFKRKRDAENNAASQMLNIIDIDQLLEISSIKSKSETGINNNYSGKISDIMINDNSPEKIITINDNSPEKIIMINDNSPEKIIMINNNSPKNISDNSSRKIIVIDLENRSGFNITDKKNIYIGFITEFHCTYEKYSDWVICEKNIAKCLETNNKILFTINGIMKDLADHLMTCFLFRIVEYLVDNPMDVDIISSDHASWCTGECMRKLLKIENININVSNKYKLNI
jgi:hypothetical protein